MERIKEIGYQDVNKLFNPVPYPISYDNSISTYYEKSNKKYSIKYDESNKPFVEIEEDILDDVDKNEWIMAVKNTLTTKFPNGVTDPQTYADKYRALNNADEIILASREYTNEGLKHARNDNIRDFARGKVLIRVGSNDYEADVIVGTTSANTMFLYDVINIGKTTIQEKTDKSYSLKEDYRKDLPVYNNSISNEDTKSNKKFSIKYDADNRPFVVIDQDILDGVKEEEWAKTVQKNLKDKYPNGINVSGQHIDVDRQSRKEMTYSEYTRHIKQK